MNTKPLEPLVSVIIPTYNRPEYLKQAITSAVAQIYQNIEIIVSDNCSPEILKHWWLHLTIHGSNFIVIQKILGC
jgi:glycosyltransferase involved in cell wall biosynthesis